MADTTARAARTPKVSLPGPVAKFTAMLNERLNDLDGSSDPETQGIRLGLTEAASLMLLALQQDDQDQRP
jgi:hypothetical protein